MEGERLRLLNRVWRLTLSISRACRAFNSLHAGSELMHWLCRSTGRSHEDPPTYMNIAFCSSNKLIRVVIRYRCDNLLP